MKKISTILTKGAMAIALCTLAIPFAKAETVDWGAYKIYLDPGHSATENSGLWGYSEAQKTLRIALDIQEFFLTYTNISTDDIRLCRYNDTDVVDLSDRQDEANAWDADFYYAIHSDASGSVSSTLTLFGGWMKDWVKIEKTPEGGQAFGEILYPNLTGAMRVTTRGNYYDRCYYDPSPSNGTHTNQYPYLAVNRRSNMPSLLSEGGDHTVASQQQLNFNDEYKRIEALAGFQSLLTYRGLALPDQTMLAGIISNSENGVPINGATVTVNGQTYTTNTWADTFSGYTKNENLIHNGFYFFEGLEAGETYDITFEADGYETYSTSVTIKDGNQGSTIDYITYLDVELTNTAPAKVERISITDLVAVSPIRPWGITFSWTMDKETVEEALSINNNGQISLSWENDYTLDIDLSQLMAEFTYKITISGDIAKNSQTDQFFDGDGDGEEGGDYVLTFTMAEPDTTPAEVVSTYPPVDGEALYTYRPPIRIEYSEELDWNDDKYADFVTVMDSDGNVYEGTLTHAVVRDASVLHFYLDEDLPLDKCIEVSVKEGLTDLSGNESDAFTYRFLTEYRQTTSAETFFALDDVSNWWAPDGSGSTAGLLDDPSSTWTASSSITYSKTSAASTKLTYYFDIDAGTPSWLIREYYSGTTASAHNSIKGILTYWVYGDGSKNTVATYIRVNSTSGGIKHPVPTPLDFRGWQLVSWDMEDYDNWQAFTGSEVIPDDLTGYWYFDSFFLTHLDLEDEDDPDYQAWDGEIYFDQVELNEYDEDAERTATLEDEFNNSGIQSVSVASSTINIACDGSILTVTATGTIDAVDVYNIAGVKVCSVKPDASSATISVDNLVSGVYVAKAVSEGTAKTVKFVK